MNREGPIDKRPLPIVPPLLLTAGATLSLWIESARVRVEHQRAAECARELRITLPMPGYLGPASWLAIGLVLAGLAVALLLPVRRRGRRWLLLCAGCVAVGVLVLGYTLVGFSSLVATMRPPSGACGG